MTPRYLRLLALVCALGARAAAADPPALDAATLKLYAENAVGKAGTRIEVTVGESEAHARLAPCARAEPFLPAGARVWGRTAIGLRCVSGAAWTTLVPVHVRVWGPAVVATRPLAVGETVAAGDVALDEVELTREPPSLLGDPAEARDKVLVRPVAAGQPVRRDALRARLVLSQGDAVKIVYRGQGFSVSADAQALASAADGQNVRVQTASGRVLTGVARSGRIVEIAF